jgi:hypothetical protein
VIGANVYVGNCIGMSPTGWNQAGTTPFTGMNGSIAGTAMAISGVSTATPTVVTATGHNFIVGEMVRIDGVVGTGGITSLNGQQFIVSAVAANTISLTTLAGVNVVGTGWTYTSGGTVIRVTSPQLLGINGQVAINAVIKNCCDALTIEGLNVVYVDIASAFQPTYTASSTSLVGLDNIHPSDLGNKVIAQKFLDRMR